MNCKMNSNSCVRTICDRGKHYLLVGLGDDPQEIFKLVSSERSFPTFSKNIAKLNIRGKDWARFKHAKFNTISFNKITRI